MFLISVQLLEVVKCRVHSFSPQLSELNIPSSLQGAITAEQVVNDWSEDRLGKLIRDYGEERYWRSIARRIAEARCVSRIRTTGELVDIVGGPRPGRREAS